MGYAILKGEGSIRAKIRELFTSRTHSRRRVVLGPLAALVPSDYFPDVRDVEFYSWGQETLPDRAPLATLAERGVRINWVNPMPLRLYWVKDQGAVIGPGLRAGDRLSTLDRENQSDLALYLDAGALMAVDEFLGPLLLEASSRETFSDLQERCNLLWRLAEGITATDTPGAQGTEALQFLASCVPPSAPQAGNFRVAPASRHQAAASKSWYDFLAEEAREPEGLLCFYDRPRTKRVDYCRRFFIGLAMLLGI